MAEAIAKNTALLESAAADVASFAVPAGSLEARLGAIREGFDGRMAIYAENVATGESFAVDADSAYETFSVIERVTS